MQKTKKNNKHTTNDKTRHEMQTYDKKNTKHNKQQTTNATLKNEKAKRGQQITTEIIKRTEGKTK